MLLSGLLIGHRVLLLKDHSATFWLDLCLTPSDSLRMQSDVDEIISRRPFPCSLALVLLLPPRRYEPIRSFWRDCLFCYTQTVTQSAKVTRVLLLFTSYYFILGVALVFLLCALYTEAVHRGYGRSLR